nr:hypothetical protein OG781_33110 [Streptomyces sp. NBC_00830]
MRTEPVINDLDFTNHVEGAQPTPVVNIFDRHQDTRTLLDHREAQDHTANDGSDLELSGLTPASLLYSFGLISMTTLFQVVARPAAGSPETQ